MESPENISTTYENVDGDALARTLGESTDIRRKTIEEHARASIKRAELLLAQADTVVVETSLSAGQVTLPDNLRVVHETLQRRIEELKEINQKSVATSTSDLLATATILVTRVDAARTELLSHTDRVEKSALLNLDGLRTPIQNVPLQEPEIPFVPDSLEGVVDVSSHVETKTHFGHDIGSFSTMLKELEAEPEKWDRLVEATKKMFTSLKTPEAQAEAKEVGKELLKIKREVEVKNSKTGELYSQKELKNRVNTFVSELLDHFEDERPIAALAEDNPLARLAVLEKAPYMQEAFAEMLKTTEGLVLPNRVPYTKNALTGSAHIINMLAVFGLTYMSWKFTSGMIRTGVTEGMPMIPGFDTVSSPAKWAFDQMGMNPARVGNTVGDTIGLGISGYISYTIASLRPKKNKTIGELTKFWLAVVLSGLGASGSITEQAADNYSAGQVGEQIGSAWGNVTGSVNALGASLTSLQITIDTNFTALAERQARTGHGPKTMLNLLQAGKLDATAQTKFDAWIAENPAGREKYRLKLNEYRNAVQKINADPRFAVLGLGDGEGVKHALDRFIGELDRTTAVDFFKGLVQRAQDAKERNIWMQLLTSLHPVPGYADSASLMLSDQDQLIGEFQKLLDRYKKLKTQDRALLVEYIQEVSQQTGVKDVLEIIPLLRFPELGLDTKSLTDAKGKVTAKPFGTVMQVITSEEGWAAVGDALRGGGVSLDTNTTDGKLSYAAMMIAIYGIVDLAPTPMISIPNAQRRERFNRELGEGFNDINELETNLAGTITTQIRGMRRSMQGVLSSEESGIAYNLPDDMLHAHIRRKLREVVGKDISALQDAPSPAGKVIGLFKPSTVLYALEAVTGTEHSPKDRKILNAYRDRLKKLQKEMIRGLKKNDLGAIAQLVETVYPEYRESTEMHIQTLKHPQGTQQYTDAVNRIRTLQQESRVEELESAAEEIRLQLAILERVAEHADTLSGSPDGSDYEPTKLLGKGDLVYDVDHIRRTYIEYAIHDDMTRLRDALHAIRASGVDIKTDTRDVISPEIEETLKNTQGNSGVSAARKAVDWSPDQAVLDSMLHQYEQKVMGYVDAEVTPALFNQYVNAVDKSATYAREVLETHIRGNGPLILRGSPIALSLDYAPEIGAPTLIAHVLGSPDAKGVSEPIASVPFTAHPIPSFSEKQTTQATLDDIRAWLAPGGDAMQSMEALVIEHELTRALAENERTIESDFESFTIPLAGADAEVHTDDTLALLMQHRALKRWSATHEQLLQTVQSGENVDYALDTLRGQYMEYMSLGALGSMANDRQQLHDAFNFIQTRSVPKHVEIWYDPREGDGHIVVHNRTTGRKERISFNASAEETEEVIAIVQHDTDEKST